MVKLIFIKFLKYISIQNAIYLFVNYFPNRQQTVFNNRGFKEIGIIDVEYPKEVALPWDTSEVH